ncbi:T9SS type A sorting domain-containing protein [Flavobacteriales bacterium AH-315-E23]|nr:T9SS type A sorting domain-containing protein [Flavobacteriales bacterium AH-315-E23]
MKKILVIIALFCISLSSNIYAQCAPETIYTTIGAPGIFPAPAEGIDTGMVGVFYSDTFTVIVPTDTTINAMDIDGSLPDTNITVTLNSMKVAGVTNLPTGLTHTCDISTCLWAGGTTGCFVVDGTPATGQGGTFAMTLSVVINVELPPFPPFFPGGPFDAPPSDIVYSLEIIDTTQQVSVSTISVSAFEVLPIAPNPSSGGAEIRFTTPDYRNVNLTIHNLIGALVISKQIYAEKGLNIVSLDAKNLKPGMYIVTLTDGKNTSTKRMIIGSE